MPLPVAIAAMIPSILDFVLGEAKEVIDRTVPDKEAAAKAKQALDEKRHDNSVTLAMQQIMANIEEIKSGHILGKWRGFLGWVAAGSFAYQFILVHFITAALLVYDPTFPVDKLPKLEWSELGKILFGMLGIV